MGDKFEVVLVELVMMLNTQQDEIGDVGVAEVFPERDVVGFTA